MLEVAALALAVTAVMLVFGRAGGGQPAAGIPWPGIAAAAGQLVVATGATIMLAIHARRFLLWRALILLGGYLAAVYCIIRVFL